MRATQREERDECGMHTRRIRATDGRIGARASLRPLSYPFRRQQRLPCLQSLLLEVRVCETVSVRYERQEEARERRTSASGTVSRESPPRIGGGFPPPQHSALSIHLLISAAPHRLTLGLLALRLGVTHREGARGEDGDERAGRARPINELPGNETRARQCAHSRVRCKCRASEYTRGRSSVSDA
jgi:hypothetical protein